MDVRGERPRAMAAIDGEAVGLQWPECLMMIIFLYSGERLLIDLSKKLLEATLKFDHATDRFK